jgi:hypothetical protein
MSNSSLPADFVLALCERRLARIQSIIDAELERDIAKTMASTFWFAAITREKAIKKLNYNNPIWRIQYDYHFTDEIKKINDLINLCELASFGKFPVTLDAEMAAILVA